ncbi:hypothetical protein ACFSTD_09840 [Novosphingobium colocasiae]
MSKITALPPHSTEDIDGTETLPIVVNGQTRQTPAGPLVDRLAQPHVDAAAASAAAAEGAAIAAEAGTNYRATIAAALADFAPGVAFVCPQVTGENPDGEDRRYLRTVGVPGYELTADQPLSKRVMQSTADGKGTHALGHKADGTGAIDRTAADVLRDDLRGADYATIQQALDKAAADTVGAQSLRRKVTLRAGSYSITGLAPLAVSEGSTLEGNGHQEASDKCATVITRADSGDGVRMGGHFTGGKILVVRPVAQSGAGGREERHGRLRHFRADADRRTGDAAGHKHDRAIHHSRLRHGRHRIAAGHAAGQSGAGQALVERRCWHRFYVGGPIRPPGGAFL